MGKGARSRARHRQEPPPQPFVAKPDPWIMATGAYTWESQARQFAETGAPGIEFRIEYADNYPTIPINVLLHRDEDGSLSGILYHYRYDMPPLEKAGNVNMWVRPDRQRQGIGRRLLAIGEMALGPFNFAQQRYSESGACMVNKYLSSKGS